MIAELKFDLPEEQEAFDTALNGWKYRKVIDEFQRYLRKQLKYIDLPKAERLVMESVKTEFYKILNDEFDGNI